VLVLDPKRVRSRLALMGWTQSDLAQKIGVSPWGLSRVMQGHATLTEEEVLRLAQVLECPGGVDDIADRYIKAC
jgi:plasmid maintenance system antidote protein VapI